MKKIPNWLTIILVLGLIIASKFLFFSTNKSDQKKASDKGNKSIAVNYYVIKPDTLSNIIHTTGKMGAMNQVDLVPELSGKVIEIYFKEGEPVKKGDLLVKLNDADLQAQLEKVKIQIQLEEQKLQRLKKLLDINGVSKEEVEQQENMVAGLKSDEKYIKAQIAKTTLLAPFDGKIGLKNLSVGAMVTTQNPVVSVVQIKPMFVEFSVPEKYSQVLKKGLTIKFKTDNNTESNDYTAEVYATESRVDETTKTIRSRAIYQGNQSFFSGSFVEVEINFGTSYDAFMVPSEAVVAAQNGQTIFLCKNQTAVELPVEIGLRNDKMIQLTKGVKVGDTVITTGLMAVRNDSKITLLKPSH